MSVVEGARIAGQLSEGRDQLAEQGTVLSITVASRTNVNLAKQS